MSSALLDSDPLTLRSVSGTNSLSSSPLAAGAASAVLCMPYAASSAAPPTAASDIQPRRTATGRAAEAADPTATAASPLNPRVAGAACTLAVAVAVAARRKMARGSMATVGEGWGVRANRAAEKAAESEIHGVWMAPFRPPVGSTGKGLDEKRKAAHAHPLAHSFIRSCSRPQLKAAGAGAETNGTDEQRGLVASSVRQRLVTRRLRRAEVGGTMRRCLASSSDADSAQPS